MLLFGCVVYEYSYKWFIMNCDIITEMYNRIVFLILYETLPNI